MRNLAAFALSALVAAGCATQPKISSQTAPQADLARYHSYGFMEKLGTDTAGYTSITTQFMKQAVARELAARGFTESDHPDLWVNFLSTSKDKVEGRTSPRLSVGYGTGWWRGGWGGGVGLGDSDIRSVRVDALTVDLIDREKNELVWRGIATYRPTEKDKNDGGQRVSDAVARIFGKYPAAEKVANAK